MDILASIFAYLVCVTGLVGTLVISFVIFFSPPKLHGPASLPAVALVAKALPGEAAKASPVTTIAGIKQTEERDPAAFTTGRPDTAKAFATEPNRSRAIADDVRQKPLHSRTHLRRLADKARAKHLAYRERSSFEARFLGFDD